ncbi:MAG: NTP transferase domain-containing protein [bacterium]
MQSVILAAGQGTRFKTDTSKLIIPICGQPMVLYVTKLIEQLSIPMTVIVGYQKELVCAAIEKAGTKDVTFVEQKELLGTGHALFVSKDTWNAENILVVNGDGPLITAEIIKALYDAHIKK